MMETKKYTIQVFASTYQQRMINPLKFYLRKSKKETKGK
jgi:hypothetical protein